MRILFLLTQDLESPSGLGRYFPLAKELVKLGNQVQIAALHANYQNLTEKRFQIDGVDVHYVAPMHVKKQNSTKNYYSPLHLLGVTLWATWALTKAALQTPSDVIQIAKPHPMNSIAGIAAKYLRRKPLFLDCDDYEAGSNRFTSKWQQNIVTYFEKRVPKVAEITTTNTHFMEEKLIAWGIPKSQILYLPNGIDPERFTLPDEITTQNLRYKLNLANKRVIAYIGSISLPSHPIDLLLKAFVKVLQNYPDSVLMIVGGGEDLPSLKQLASQLGIQNHTYFIGKVPPEEVPLYYSIADVTVDPVYDDDAARGRSPLKLFESWICGVPFVTADVGDRREIMNTYQTGALVEPGDADALSRGILQMLFSPDISEYFGKSGFEQLSNFFWSCLTIRLAEKYHLP